jgi:hypothetical protein
MNTIKIEALGADKLQRLCASPSLFVEASIYLREDYYRPAFVEYMLRDCIVDFVSGEVTIPDQLPDEYIKFSGINHRSDTPNRMYISGERGDAIGYTLPIADTTPRGKIIFADGTTIPYTHVDYPIIPRCDFKIGIDEFGHLYIYGSEHETTFDEHTAHVLWDMYNIRAKTAEFGFIVDGTKLYVISRDQRRLRFSYDYVKKVCDKIQLDN